MSAPSSIHHVAIRDTRLAVHTAGAGVPLLLLHGFPLDHAMWAAQEPLADHVRLVVPDQRGFGASVGAGPTCFEVLADTKLEADTPEARAARGDLAAKAGRLGQRIVADAMVPRLLAASAEARSAAGRAGIEAALHEAIMRQPVATIQAALAALGARPDMTAAMRGVRVPTLLVVGAEDAITPPACLEAALEIMPHARLLVVPQAGHMTPLEAPAVFNRAVLEFLEAERVGQA